MHKLTLSVDAAVVERAKAYARAQGTSVSALVEKMLDMAAGGHSIADVTPAALGRLRGSLKRGSVADYRRHLGRKHRRNASCSTSTSCSMCGNRGVAHHVNHAVPGCLP